MLKLVDEVTKIRMDAKINIVCVGGWKGKGGQRGGGGGGGGVNKVIGRCP